MTKRCLPILPLVVILLFSSNLHAQARFAIYGTGGGEKSGVPNDDWHGAGTFGFYYGILHAAIFMGLYVLLDLRQFGTPYAAVGGQAIGNAAVGVLAFQLAELLPGAMERRRAQKTRLRH